MAAQERAVSPLPGASVESAVVPGGPVLIGLAAAALVSGRAALLVIAGLYLVNKPDPKLTPDPNVPA